MSKTIELNDGWLYCEDGVPKDRVVVRKTKAGDEVSVESMGYRDWVCDCYIFHEDNFEEKVWREVTKPDMSLIKKENGTD